MNDAFLPKRAAFWLSIFWLAPWVFPVLPLDFLPSYYGYQLESLRNPFVLVSLAAANLLVFTGASLAHKNQRRFWLVSISTSLVLGSLLLWSLVLLLAIPFGSLTSQVDYLGQIDVAIIWFVSFPILLLSIPLLITALNRLNVWLQYRILGEKNRERSLRLALAYTMPVLLSLYFLALFFPESRVFYWYFITEYPGN